MYAVVKTGGKQYRVTTGDVIEVEKLADAEEGKKFELTDVLAVGDKIGTPLVSGAKVMAEVVAQKRAPKVTIFKKKRRQNYRRTRGHKQPLTVLKITDVKGAA